MNTALIMPAISLLILGINCTTMILTFPSKRGLPFTIGVLALFTTALVTVLHFIGTTGFGNGDLAGLVYLPVMALLFKGALFQKIFAFFLQFLLTELQQSFAAAIGDLFTPSGGNISFIVFLVLLAVMFTAYIIMILKVGRPIFKRLFVYGRPAEWALYSFGAVFAFAVLTATNLAPGKSWHIVMILGFILWSFLVLCFTIINTNEKTKKSHEAETLVLQMNAMRQQVEADTEYRRNMSILRHDIRHQIGMIVELARAGKTDEAEKAYEAWLAAMEEAVPVTLCAEPFLNAVLSLFERRAREKNIPLCVSSRLPGSIPVDTIKLSIVLSNALENALTAAEKIPAGDKAVHIKFVYSKNKIGLEIINPCVQPVEFDENGFPVTRERGHGIGVRSIVAFAEENNCILEFKYADGRFIMRLIMNV